MSEKTKVRVTAVFLFPAILIIGAIVSLLVEGEVFGQVLFTGVFPGVLWSGLLLVWPEIFSQSRIRERRQNRTGQIIVVVLFGVALFSLAALLLVSYINGYRIM